MIIQVKVKPNSSEQKIAELEGNHFLVHLKRLPQKNKANIELINLLSRHFKVPHQRIKIKSGATNSDKLVEIL